MAKGNDGNLLQHTVECEIVRELLAQSGASRLNLIATHGMAPFESLTDTGRPNTKLLRDWLDVATGRIRKFRFEDCENLPAVVRAYRQCHTTFLHYPNTPELAAALVGRGNLDGFVCELNGDTCKKLKDVWDGTKLGLLHGEWRDHVDQIAAKIPNEPWLVTMDPNTFEFGDVRRLPANFHSSDFDHCRKLVKGRLQSNLPGSFCLCCYSMNDATERRFHEECTTFAASLDCQPSFLRVQAQNGRDHAPRFHVGLILSNQPDLVKRIESTWEKMKLGPSKW